MKCLFFAVISRKISKVEARKTPIFFPFKSDKFLIFTEAIMPSLSLSKKEIISILNEIREKIPEAVIRTTFIVGYPGETEKRFQELKEFIEDFKFERLGIFTYSKEENTKAFHLPNQISRKIALKRKDELMEIQQSISQDFLESLIGKNIDVICCLIEH